MTDFSDFYEGAIINTMRDIPIVNCAAYVALFTGATNLEINVPTLEVSAGNYGRQLAGLAAPSGGASSNAANITFPTATANWGTISHVALVDHVTNVNWGTGVNVRMWGALNATKVVNIGDTFMINTGDLDVTVT